MQYENLTFHLTFRKAEVSEMSNETSVLLQYNHLKIALSLFALDVNI